MLNVPEPSANKNAVYHQLGLNLAAARRAIEQLQGDDSDEAHAVEPGGTMAEDVWNVAISSMAVLWSQHKPQEVVPGGTAHVPVSWSIPPVRGRVEPIGRVRCGPSPDPQLLVDDLNDPPVRPRGTGAAPLSSCRTAGMRIVWQGYH